MVADGGPDFRQMASYGEAEIHVETRICGEVRVLNLSHQALAPRLQMTLGVTLTETNDPLPGLEGVAMFELRDLLGELRLSEDREALGTVFWMGARRGDVPDSVDLLTV